MGKFLQKTEEIMEKIAERRISVAVWILSFLGIMAIREFLEGFVAAKASSIIEETLIDYVHNVFFFGLSFLLVIITLKCALKINFNRVKNALFLALWLAILPPLIDMARTGGEVFWSFYLLSDIKTIGWQFLTFFGHLPTGVVYFGTKIVVAATVVLAVLLIFIESRRMIKALIGGLLVYAVLFFMGSFPSWFAYGFYFFEKSKKIAEIKSLHIAQLLGGSADVLGVKFENLKYSLAHNLNFVYYIFLLSLLAILFFSIDRKRVIAVIKNARWPQVVYHGGLFFIGIGLGFLSYPEKLNLNFFSVLAVIDLLLAVGLAWEASVIVNDVYDFEVDKISNPERPLQKGIFEKREYLEIGIIFFILSLSGGFIISPKFAALLFVYQFLAWAYSAYPYRLKRFPVIATAMSSIASLTVLFLGFSLFSGDQNIQELSWRIILMFFVTLTLSLPIKDFKDVEGDKKYEVWTIPVIFGEEKGRLITAAGVFVSFMLSVFFLNEFRLFWWALLFGAVAFLIITSEKTKPRQLFWRVMAVVAAYGMILVKILFLA